MEEAAARYEPRPVPHMGPPAAEWSAAAPLPPDWPAGPVPPEWAAATAPPDNGTSKTANTASTTAADSLIRAMQEENEAKSARVLLCLQAKDEEIAELHAANEALREALSVREQSIEELQLSQQARHAPHTCRFLRAQISRHREPAALSAGVQGKGWDCFRAARTCTHLHAPRACQEAALQSKQLDAVLGERGEMEAACRELEARLEALSQQLAEQRAATAAAEQARH